MEEVQIFSNGNTNLPVKEVDGQIYFAAEQSAIGLGISHIANSGNEVVRWDRVNKYLGVPTSGHGKIGKGDWISEPQFYKLAFKASNEVAERFQDWVASDVLPAIRKTGSYQVTAQKDSYMIEDPIERAKRWIQEQEEKERAEKQLKLQEPKVIYFDEIVDKKGLTGIRETGKMLKVGQSGFVRFLLDHHYAYRSQKGKLQAYSKYCGKYFEVKDTASGFTQTFVTPEGRAHFNELIRKAEKNDKSE